MARPDLLKTSGGDPRRPQAAKKYSRPVVNADDQPPDPMLLMALVFGVLALLMKMKVCAWCSVFCCISSLANMKSELMDLKHIISSVTFAVMGLVASYLVPVSHQRRSSG
ncbi:unnamed protein product [Ostreobium quekettii]|uniref:Protein Asterix n=1 Tax=Ostreobium quekettii TaxID=121088 RepID=A0A8S1J2E2_9CHLO|nr:unnamed protein product [Ostreobium quekettii]